MLSPFDLPNKSTLLVTDELFSPADFIIHSQFASQAKNPSYKCLIVSMLPDVSRWKAIGAKSVDITSSLQPNPTTYFERYCNYVHTTLTFVHLRVVEAGLLRSTWGPRRVQLKDPKGIAGGSIDCLITLLYILNEAWQVVSSD
ncbi:hypothetical protein EYR36_011880 [Pleurotus pulmonarius]|nr:hypothetical protein EYR36_011880 [Pleurotus pulmonarius]